MKRLLIMLCLLMCLCGAALAEQVTDNDDGTTPIDLLPELTRPGCVVDLTLDPRAEWAFAPGAEILEVVFPQMAEADACILRMNGHVMMIDAGGEKEAEAVAQALRWMGVTEVETGLNTHPHHDHLPGFAILAQQIRLDRVLNAFALTSTQTMKREAERLAALGIPLEPVAAGDVLTIAGKGERVEVFQVAFDGASVNNRSLMVRVVYGQRSLLLMADVEKETERRLVSEPPACGLSADILKYPHHGLARMVNSLVELIRPRLCVITNTLAKGRSGAERMAEYFVPTRFTADHALRLRTDGVIWVADWLTGPEK